MTVTVVPTVAGNRYRSLNCCEQQPPDTALFTFVAQQYWPLRQSATGPAPDAATVQARPSCQPESVFGRAHRQRTIRAMLGALPTVPCHPISQNHVKFVLARYSEELPTFFVRTASPDISHLTRHLVVWPAAEAVVKAGVIRPAAHAHVLVWEAGEIGDEGAIGKVTRTAPSLAGRPARL